MSDIPAFTLPDFLKGQSADDIHAEMLLSLPDEYDKSEGGFIWDLTYPTALEKARAAQYLIPEALRAMFPCWARGDMLDMHAQNRGMARRAATYAASAITLSGTDGTRVPAGTSFSTTGDIAFETLSDSVIENGTVDVSVRAVNVGADGNVAAGSICRADVSVTGLSAVTNAHAAQGGADEEDDESLRARIALYDTSRGESNVGSMSDYRRWALEVAGVGDAVVKGAQDQSGTVTIIITDTQGAAAADALIKQVEEHIMSPDDPFCRLAPINALIDVKTPATREISVSAQVVTGAVELDAVKSAFQDALKVYFVGVRGGTVRLTQVGALLSSIEGVNDYSLLTLDGGTDNIALDDMQLPTLAGDGVNLYV